jgi:hypothetical protein
MLHRTEARALRDAPEIFVASDYTKRRLPRWHPSVRSPVSVVSGGANFSQFQPPTTLFDVIYKALTMPILK